MALNQDMQDIIKTIYNPVFIYIPTHLFSSLKLSNIKALENVGIFNNLFVLDKNGVPKDLSNGLPYICILGKSKILKANIFQLLEMQSKLAKQTFSFLLNDYSKELDSWVVASEIIMRDAKQEAINYKSEHQSYLKLQHSTFKEHQLELKTHFEKWKVDFELDKIAKVIGYNRKNKNIESDIKPITKEKPKVVVNHNNTSSKFLVRKVYLSNEECDKYLLKAVFNVKIV